MSEQVFNTRIIHKHDIAANWDKAINFIPKSGELIIYDPDENFNYSRIKMGDGIKTVYELPFIDDQKADKNEIIQADWSQNNETANDYIKNRPFYEEEVVELIFPSTELDDSQKITIENTRASGDQGLVVGEKGYKFTANLDLKNIDEIKIDRQYEIIFNDVIYTCVGLYRYEEIPEPILYIGNGYLIDPYIYENTGEPFCIAAALDDITSEIFLDRIYITVDPTQFLFGDVINVYWKYIDGIKINKLHERYISDSIARVSKVLASINPSGIGSFSMNRKAGTVIGEASHAEGINTTAEGEASHAEGNLTRALEDYAHAEGRYTIAFGESSHAEGASSTFLQDLSFISDLSQTKAVWEETPFLLAHGHYSHAEGMSTLALGFGSHAEGNKTITEGEYSHAEGTQTNTEGEASHAEGYNTSATSTASHAEGSGTSARGIASHAEGSGTSAIGIHSHAEGLESTAEGEASHAEGFMGHAIGKYSHAEGYITRATGDYSHVEGKSTRAHGAYSHVQGKTNIPDDENKYAHIVGNGGDYYDEASNAHTLDWEGNAWYSGDVYVGSTSGVNRDEGSKKLATEEYVINKLNEFNLISIDYENLLGFDTSEIVIERNTSSVLGQAMLGQLVLV